MGSSSVDPVASTCIAEVIPNTTDCCHSSCAKNESKQDCVGMLTNVSDEIMIQHPCQH